MLRKSSKNVYTTVELELSEDEVLLVIASFEAEFDDKVTIDFLTSEVLIGPLVILEVKDEDLVGAVAGLLELEDPDEEVTAFVDDVVAGVGSFLDFGPLFTGLFLHVASAVLLTLVSSTGVSSTSLIASLIVSVLDFCSS